MENIKKKKILIANTHMEIGGIETSLLSLLKNIDTSKYDVDLMIFKMNGPLLSKIPNSINVIPFYKSYRLGSIFEKIILSKNKLMKVIKFILFNYYTAGMYVNKNKEYDIAIDFSGYYGFVDKYIIKSKAGKKFIWCHSNVKWNYDNNEFFKKKFNKTRDKYNYFDKIVVVSESSRKELACLMPEHASKMINIYNVFSVEKTDEENISEKAKEIILKMKESRKYKLISVGRIVLEKSFDRLVDITSRLIKEGIDVETYLVGSGPMESIIREEIKECGIEEAFHITGYIGNVSDVLSIVENADLFVGTSITEGLPTAIIEALSTGIQIVLPNTFGYIDIYNDIAPEDSIVLTRNNIGDLYSNIKNIIEKNEKTNYTFDIDKINKKTLAKLDSLINGEI